MALVRVIMSGRVFDSATAGNAIEEWSASLSLLSSPAPDVVAELNAISPAIVAWFEDSDTRIHPSVSLELITCNEVDVTTGIQVNDPTVFDEFVPGLRGGGAEATSHPLGTSYKISLDTGSRDRTTKGGFFVPRTSMVVGTNGRWDAGHLAAAMVTAETLIDAINDANGSYMDVGIWSRKNNSVTKATRLRIGDVPDNISRRRRQLDEVYSVQAITT